jgi:hypothetical protein
MMAISRRRRCRADIVVIMPVVRRVVNSQRIHFGKAAAQHYASKRDRDQLHLVRLFLPALSVKPDSAKPA